jgi:hypothetical protein
MMMKAMPGMEFVPAGMLMRIKTVLDTFHMKRVTFGGAHPNCESVSLLISDGKTYNPASRYLKRPFTEVIREAVEKDAELTETLKRSLIVKMFGETGKKIACGMALLGVARRSLNFREVFGGSATLKIARIVWGLMRGKKMKHLLRQHTRCHGILRVMVLPFEEKECVESARLVECPTSFAYEHPVTGEIRLMPVCAWPIYKNSVLRETSKRYGVVPASGVEVASVAQVSGTI